MRAVLLASALVLLSDCGAVGAADPAEPPREDAVILPAAAIPELLNQCSRAAPARGEDSWRPGWADVDALRRVLPGALKAEPQAAEIVADGAPDGWRAQYVGLVREGRRYVYANFFPPNASNEDDWRTRPVMICDGGPWYFGAEYDVTAGRITHLAFNGLA